MSHEEQLEGVLLHKLTGVREYTESYPVEIRRNTETGRLMLTAWNEGHNNMTQVDLLDLVEWLRINSFHETRAKVGMMTWKMGRRPK